MLLDSEAGVVWVGEVPPDKFSFHVSEVSWAFNDALQYFLILKILSDFLLIHFSVPIFYIWIYTNWSAKQQSLTKA